MLRILIVGCGDIARRLAPLLTQRYRVYGLIRNPDQRYQLAGWGVRPVIGDLDRLASLGKLGGLAHIVIHLAPPQPAGESDDRTLHLISALSGGHGRDLVGRPRRCRMLPHCLVYIGTTGEYGNCAGALISETHPLRPQSVRAVRRQAAEQLLRDWGRRTGVAVSILRVPGIYALDRLPLERLRNATPALLGGEDVYTNHVHADDLARIIAGSLQRMRPERTYNCVDNSDLKMGDYLDLVADRVGLPRPPRISLQEAEKKLPTALMSFLRESRRVDNRRLKEELGVRLCYPTVADALIRMSFNQDSRRNSPSIIPPLAR